MLHRIKSGPLLRRFALAAKAAGGWQSAFNRLRRSPYSRSARLDTFYQWHRDACNRYRIPRERNEFRLGRAVPIRAKNRSGDARIISDVGIAFPAVRHSSRAEESPARFLFWTAAGIVVVAMVATPSFVSARTTASVNSSTASPLILNRQVVGAFDTVTLQDRSGEKILRWLNENGFVVATNLRPVMQAYAQEGWCFAAAKLHRVSEDAEATRIHPLAFTFATERPVYPLRLTGVNNDSCRIELYVFGPGKAANARFKTDRCAMISTSAPAAPAQAIPMVHPALRRFAAESIVATKLSAEFTSRQMTQDAWIEWTPCEVFQKTVYTTRGAHVFAFNWAMLVFVTASAILYARRGTLSLRVFGIILFASGLVWTSVVHLLPKTEARIVRGAWAQVKHLHRNAVQRVHLAVDEANKERLGFQPGAAWIRSELAKYFAAQNASQSALAVNPYVGGSWREEDSPGNYLLRQTREGLEYVWFDVNGSERIEEVFPLPAQ
jgi:hypothetical protein